MRPFDEFLVSGDSLRVYEGGELIFASTGDRLLPLMEYIDRFSPCHRQVTLFDKMVGNAAALLAVRANCQEIHGPVGSQHAIRTLEEYGIRHYLGKVVPYIEGAVQKDMCPMERMSLGKEPEEFYQVMRGIIRMSQEEQQPGVSSGGD